MTADQLEKDIKLIKYTITTGIVTSNKTTFKSAILSLFEDGIPKTSRHLLAVYNETATKKFEFSDFSGRLSILVKKEIKKHVFNSKPIENRFYYGKLEWFVGNKLKDKFLKRIK